MPYSMTGFGKAQKSDENSKISIEIKSVNSRYLEIITKMPKSLNQIEDKIKATVRNYLTRGRIDIFITVEKLKVSDSFSVDGQKLIQYKNMFDEIEKTTGIENDMKLSNYLLLENVVKRDDLETQSIQKLVIDTLEQALEELVKMRKFEALKIIEDLKQRTEHLKKMIEEIHLYTNDMTKSLYEKINARIKEILDSNDVQIQEARILQEAAIYADKFNITEEIVRFNSHIIQLEGFLSEEKSDIGKKCDFLIQELNREINTIGSKSQKTEIISLVVDVKAEIEKIREQIQNIQ